MAGPFVCFTHCCIPSTEARWVVHIRRWKNIFQVNQYIIVVLKKSNRQPLGTISSLIISLFAPQHCYPCPQSMSAWVVCEKKLIKCRWWCTGGKPQGLKVQMRGRGGSFTGQKVRVARATCERRNADARGKEEWQGQWQRQPTRGSLFNQSRKAV